jgi:hypothetical protein
VSVLDSIRARIEVLVAQTLIKVLALFDVFARGIVGADE